jgi:hypothetical protein
MAGIATFTMVTSSTAMKLPTTSKITGSNHRVWVGPAAVGGAARWRGGAGLADTDWVGPVCPPEVAVLVIVSPMSLGSLGHHSSSSALEVKGSTTANSPQRASGVCCSAAKVTSAPSRTLHPPR